MSGSKKSPDKGSILSKIIPSVDEIDRIDVDNSKDVNKEDNKRKRNNKKNNEINNEKGNEGKYFEEGLTIIAEIKEFLYNDLKKKFSLLVICGIVIGVILIIFGISLMLGDAEKVVDHVASGETGSSSIFVIILGIIILGVSILKFFQNAEPISNPFEKLDNLTLLNKDDYDDEYFDNDQVNKNHLDEVDSSSNENYEDLEEISKLKNSDEEPYEIIVEHDQGENLEENNELKDSDEENPETTTEHDEIIVEHNQGENPDEINEPENPPETTTEHDEIIVEHNQGENLEENNELKDSDEENPENIIESDASTDFSDKDELEEKKFMNSNINKKTSTKSFDNTFNKIAFNEGLNSEKNYTETTLFDFY